MPGGNGTAVDDITLSDKYTVIVAIEFALGGGSGVFGCTTIPM